MLQILRICLFFVFVSFGTVALAQGAALQAPDVLKIPAFTGYCDPDPNGVQISEQHGVRGWRTKEQSLSWYGRFEKTGRLEITLLLRLPEGESSRLKMLMGQQKREAKIIGKGNELVRAVFSPFRVETAGYQRIELAGLEKSGQVFGDLDSLELRGEPIVAAHFNLLERRNAASVHLGFPVANTTKVTAFYNEITVRTEPLWSYYMACGFHRGYFGIQVNSPTERRIIFSVWDSGNEAIDRDKVKAEDRVQLLAKGEKVYAGGFGNEGTGGHSHLVYSWNKETTYRFLVTAKPKGTITIYSGYFWFPERKAWGLIARFRAPKDGSHLKGLYSFNENFIGSNGHLRRIADFSNQWILTANGQWEEITSARFTHDVTGRKDRYDYSAGVRDGKFYLSNGGFVKGNVKYGDMLQRPAGGTKPSDIDLSKLP